MITSCGWHQQTASDDVVLPDLFIHSPGFLFELKMNNSEKSDSPGDLKVGR
jgi:hypothetical protein